MYEGIVTGDVVVSGKSQGENGDLLSIIDRIESADGDILYRPQRLRKTLLDKKTSLVIGHVLENVVKFGTGRYADKNIKLAGEDSEGEDQRLQNLGFVLKTFLITPILYQSHILFLLIELTMLTHLLNIIFLLVPFTNLLLLILLLLQI